MSYEIYTKDSYSSKAPKRLLFICESEEQARWKLRDLKKDYSGVIFFSVPQTELVDRMEGS